MCIRHISYRLRIYIAIVWGCPLHNKIEQSLLEWPRYFLLLSTVFIINHELKKQHSNRMETKDEKLLHSTRIGLRVYEVSSSCNDVFLKEIIIVIVRKFVQF